MGSSVKINIVLATLLHDFLFYMMLLPNQDRQYSYFLQDVTLCHPHTATHPISGVPPQKVQEYSNLIIKKEILTLVKVSNKRFF